MGSRSEDAHSQQDEHDKQAYADNARGEGVKTDDHGALAPLISSSACCSTVFMTGTATGVRAGVYGQANVTQQLDNQPYQQHSQHDGTSNLAGHVGSSMSMVESPKLHDRKK